MEMCWRSAAEASARGARQWRCAGEEQLRQAQGALANGDVLAKTSGGKRKGRSPMEMCWRGAAAASARGARQWRCAGKEQVRQVQGALANGDVPLPMALPSIVGDRYRAQQASLAAEQDPHATDFEGERYYWN